MSEQVAVRLVGAERTETLELTPAEAERICRPTSVELLRTVADAEPSSIRETARLVGRDVRQVHDNLWQLGRLDVVRFEREGQAHRPVVPYERLEVEISV